MTLRNTFSIPTNPATFHAFQQAAVPIFVAKGTLYGIPALSLTNLSPKTTKWNGLVLICETAATKGPGATANRNEFQPDYSGDIGMIIEDFLMNNPNVTAADRLTFHIHPMGGAKGVLPVPTSTVVGKVTYMEPLAHYFGFTDTVTGKRAKPKGVSFVELRYVISLLPPTSVDDCHNTIFLNKNKKKIQFSSADEGKKGWYFGRYVNKNGDFGPWCAMFSAGII